MSNLLQSFIPEARDLIKTVVENLLLLEDAPTDTSVIEELFRAMHTLKGSSGIFDMPPFTGLTHSAEDLLDEHRDSGEPLSSDAIDRLLEASDVLIGWIDALEDAGELPADAADVSHGLSDRIHAMARSGSAAEDGVAESGESGDAAAFLACLEPRATEICGSVAEASPDDAPLTAIRYTPEADCFFTGDDPLLTWSKLPEMIAWEMVLREPWPGIEEFDPYACNLVFVGVSTAPRTEIAHLFRYVSNQIELSTIDSLSDLEEAATPASLEQRETGKALPAIRQRLAQDLIKHQATMVAGIDLSKEGDAGRLASISKALGNVARSVPPLRAVADALPQLIDDALASGDTRQVAAAVREAEALFAEVPAAPMSAPETAPIPAVAEKPAAATGTPSPAPSTVAKPAAQTASGGSAASAPERNDTAGGTGEGNKTKKAGQPGGSRSMIRIEESRLDSLMNLIGELVVAKNALPYLAQQAETEFDVPDLSREITSQYTVVDRLAHEMQTEMLQLRMMPISDVFDRFPRLVRDVTKKLGKKVRLDIVGGDTQVDKSIVESLGDPMIHIIRNALDHGLETPEERGAFGKNDVGHLKISAHSEADQIIVKVADDGRGVNREKVKRKALERGLITAEEATTMSDEAVVELIFRPGFSTNTDVTDLSGRGVGMDVAVTTIRGMGGKLQVTSDEGKGTTVRLSLPLSMAISRLVVVKVGSALYGIPMDMIFQMVRVMPDEVKLVQGREVIVLRGEIVPLIRLQRIFNGAKGAAKRAEGPDAVVVTASGNQLFGFVVDDLQERMETIVKPLEGVVSGLPGFVGTSLMGDGRVLLVLNPEEMAHAHAH
ncbi:MAG: chemotaxis protein CheA [Pseudomonadota bacterium]